MKNFMVTLFCISLLGCYQYNKDITVQELKTNISYLASDSLKGRMTGSPEIKKAADYIANEFKKIGLTPIGDSSSYLKSYPFISSAEIGTETFLKDQSKQFTVKQDFVPLAFSHDAAAENLGIAFVGYAATVPEKNYDDFSKVDVKNKVVIAFRGIPEEGNPHSLFSNSASLRTKTRLAQQAGAKAIIFVNTQDETEDPLVRFDYDRATSQGIPAFSVKRSVVEEWLKLAGKQNLTLLENKIKSTLKPNSLEIGKTTLSYQVVIKLNEAPAYNVVGLLHGSDPELSKEYVVIGAHYDHWGMGGSGSLYRGSEPQIHNGADDNASGTAGVIELAQALAGSSNQPKRSVIFALFSGEELGLLGSKALVDHFPVDLKNVVTMFNFDMIGRMDSTKKLIIHGMGTSPEFKPMLDSLNQSFHFKISWVDDGFGPSDHSSFYSKDIPVIFFFTDLHSDYHRPSDDADKIEYENEKELLDYAKQAVDIIVNQPIKPEFTKVKATNSTSSSTFNVTFGIIPDYGATSGGLRIIGVNPGSAAEKAGLKTGDIITKIGDNIVNNIYDYTGVLGVLVADKSVSIIYKRDGKDVKGSIVPMKRKQ